MKILKLLFMCTALALLAAGCAAITPQVVEPEPEPEAVGAIAEFFPFNENRLITMDRTDFGLETSYTIFTDSNRMQRLTSVGGFMVVEVFEINDGELKVNHARIMASGFEPLLDKVDEVPMVILREPLKLGNSWETHTGPTTQGVARGTSTITAVNVEIETPYGLAEAIEVTTEFENGTIDISYFARGMGLVQSGHFIQGFERQQESGRFFMEDINVDLTLSSIRENTPLTVELQVFHPNDDADDLDYTQASFNFMTNDDIRAGFEQVLRNPGNRHGIISENTVVNFIDISWVSLPDNPGFEAAAVHLDLSEDFSLDMQVGISYEQLILTSLEATFVTFFNAQEFVLTVGGRPHVSIH